MNREGRRAIVVGGSLGGLFAAHMLRSVGWEAEVYERSENDLESRGGGIVQQPEVVEVFRRLGLDPDGPAGVIARERVFLDPRGEIASLARMPQKQTSWGAIYQALRAVLPESAYHRGHELVALRDEGDAVLASFANRVEVRGDLLIGADGGTSTVRQLLFPEVKPEYAGYVAFRGLVAENDVARSAVDVLHERFGFYQYTASHILSYLVAGEDGDVTPGRRRYNWVWYRNVDPTDLDRVLTDRDGRKRQAGVPPGKLSSAVESDLRLAAYRELPPPYCVLVEKTKEPFVQAIVDLGVPRMVVGRVALIGDAAFIPRPHTAASTAKAAANALTLAGTLSASSDVNRALSLWEPDQLELGRSLAVSGAALGRNSGLGGRGG